MSVWQPKTLMHRDRAVYADPIVAKVSRAMNIDVPSILSDARWSHFVDARAVVVMAMRRRGASYSHIGRSIGCDHSSARHLAVTFDKRAARKPHLAALVERLAA